MLRRLKSHLDTTMDKFLSAETKDENSKPSKFEYSRPEFLHLNDEKLKVSQDFANRPIVTPSDQLPFNAGYAEYEIIIFFKNFYLENCILNYRVDEGVNLISMLRFFDDMKLHNNL